MTRTSLLHILDHATALGADDVRELEQLAQAFPYCQTAHLLLAKAAHDQGTMLASQRLRRAATYAADRALLRQLIEAVPEARPVESIEELPAVVMVPADLVSANTSAPEAAPASATPIETAATTEAHVVAVVQATVVEPLAILPTTKVVTPPLLQAAPMIPAAETVSTDVPAVNAAPEMAAFVPHQTQLQPSAEAIATPKAIETVAALVAVPATVKAYAPEETVTQVSAFIEVEAEPEAAAPTPPLPPVVVPIEAEAIAASIPTVAAAAATPETSQAPPEAISLPSSEAISLPSPDDVLAAAPPVRPPEDAVTARLEFGLSDEVPAAPAYLLPGLSDEWTWPMPEKPAPVPVLTPAAFTGDAEIGYGWGEGSRLGWALLPLQTIADDTAEAIETKISAAPVAAPLPLIGDYFPPDALLLAHWAEHGPATLPPPSALDLIDNFLRQRPRLTRPTLHKATTEALADLSTPSTRPEPEMASETLAKILARQGKTGRAIEIYERLMVKQPEKMAYFAAEIQQLQLQQPPLA